MAKEYVPVYFDWLENTQDLSPEEKGNLIDAVVCYAAGLEYEHLLTGGTKIAFRFMKGQVDRNEAISKVRAKAGASKAEQAEASENKQEQTGANDNKPEQTETNANKPEQTETNSLKEKNKEKDKEKEKDKQKQMECAARFARFWAAYPRKQDKAKAQKTFERLNPDDDMLSTMIAALEQQKRSDQWIRDSGQYIPHPTTWLNGRRWEDEVPKGGAAAPKRVSAQNYTQREYTEDQLSAMANNPLMKYLQEGA